MADRLHPGAKLGAGGHIRSTNGRYLAIIQGDGNLVVYADRDPIWASNTAGKGPSTLVNQTDNNLVVYDQNGHPTWSSGTNGKGSGSTTLIMQNDGNLVLYDGSSHALWASGTNREAKHRHHIFNPYAIGEGENITSPNGRFRAVVQSDGNFVLYKDGSHPIWASNTNGKGRGPYRVEAQNDGNLVLYDGTGAATWASGTNGKASDVKLVVQDDGNLVLYQGSSPLWASGTNGK